MVSTRPPTSKSSSPFSNHLVTVPNAPITIGIIVTCMFHSFFNSLARSRYLSFQHSFSFILWSFGTAKSTISQVLSVFCWLFLGLVFWPRLGDPTVSQSPKRVCVCHSPGQLLGCSTLYTIYSYWHLPSWGYSALLIVTNRELNMLFTIGFFSIVKYFIELVRRRNLFLITSRVHLLIC